MQNELSIFIDESGDFGVYESHAPLYIVSMVLHEQAKDISKNITVLNEHIHNLGYSEHAIHVGPLIRRESMYKDDLTEDRKRLFSALFNFTRKLPVNYISANVNKKECQDVVQLTAKLSSAISALLREHIDYFENFDNIIVYYDNGQVELTKILTSVFSVMFSNVEFRKVKPVDYKLFQVADLICTMELISYKVKSQQFSKSETEFFHSPRDFNKNYYKWLKQKHI